MDDDDDPQLRARALAEELAGLIRAGYVAIDDLSRPDMPRFAPTAAARAALGDSPRDLIDQG